MPSTPEGSTWAHSAQCLPNRLPGQRGGLRNVPEGKALGAREAMNTGAGEGGRR